MIAPFKDISDLPDAPMALFIADGGDSKDRNAVQRSFRDLRTRMRPPQHTSGSLIYLHDDMYFGDSKYSIGIQLADLCGYFIARHLQGDAETEGFYNLFSERIVYSKTDPQ
jgi:hypothetical protein